MLHKMFEGKDWFAPKRYGFGAGLPIAPQGWALLLAYIGTLAGLRLMIRAHFPGSHPLALALFVIATIVFVVIVARHTRGGWKWRWGSKD